MLTKVFPGALNPDEIYARLREPFGYWNSVGLIAAMAVPGCLWLGARRSGHAALNALAYPALALLLVGLLLAYSRGSLLALRPRLRAVVRARPAAPARRRVLATGGARPAASSACGPSGRTRSARTACPWPSASPPGTSSGSSS